MLLGKTFCQERIANRAGKRDVNDTASMHVSDFRTSEAEFPASKAVRINRYVWPRGDLGFKALQVRHNPNSIDSLFDD